MSPVVCHLSHVINANSHSQQPWTLPPLTPPLCKAGWRRPNNHLFFPQGNFRPFLSQNNKFLDQLSLLLCEESVCNKWLLNLLTCADSSIETDKTHSHSHCYWQPQQRQQSKPQTLPLSPANYTQKLNVTIVLFLTDLGLPECLKWTQRRPRAASHCMW